MSRSQDVKHIVNALHQHKREDPTLHRKVHRLWGWYDSIVDDERIQAKPGAIPSQKKKHHGAEHCVVVSATAEITRGVKGLLRTASQPAYIPLGDVYRLASPGTTPSEIIEVQSGSHPGEDDIVRFEDAYGRTNA